MAQLRWPARLKSGRQGLPLHKVVRNAQVIAELPDDDILGQCFVFEAANKARQRKEALDANAILAHLRPEELDPHAPALELTEVHATEGPVSQRSLDGAWPDGGPIRDRRRRGESQSAHIGDLRVDALTEDGNRVAERLDSIILDTTFDQRLGKRSLAATL